MTVAACSPAGVFNAVTPSNGVRVARDLAYGADPRQKMDVYRPSAPQAGQPAVVFFYGGSWNGGSKATYPFLANTLARHGVLVFVPDYRLYPQVTYPAFLHDCAQAVVWAQAHAAQFGGRADDVFLMGHSAGGFNAAMLALRPSLLREAGGDRGNLRGMIGLAGPYDFLPMVDPEVIAVFNGGKTDPENQPITYADGKAPPLLLLQGTDDTTVYPKNTINLAHEVRVRGGAAETHLYPGVGHIGLMISMAPLFAYKDAALADTLEFIARHKVVR